ncbi:MAG TPA: transcription antitermination factor NusB [Candidatus Paceibacterota bacterium]|nr:transcription antitermination factor NusB [Candidatus Paceibacterota bacterium]
MANRHLCRSLAMQVLFELDFREGNSTKFIDETVERVVNEFAPGMEDLSYVKELTDGVISHIEKIDAVIEKAAPDWPIEQIAAVDRNILRLGLYELIFSDRADVPAKVAINEAIELAKTFGGESSGRFVNGVLGTVYKELGEPGKNDVPAKKKKIIDIPYDQMPIEQLGGAVVFSREGNDIFLAMVHDVFGRWTLSKGHIEAGENVEAGTIREIKEEMGIDIKIIEGLGSNEYIASDPEKGKTRRQVNYFLAEVLGKPKLVLEEGKGGLDDVRWFPLVEVPELNMYDDMVPIITKAIKILLK